ncbi:hypothetical protein C2G38_2139144 [Gigaspora rosea]|uniref:Uncharacterized protein n=1 Tax=Gigaspora rosea TaxID=44941 RepID=A0A397VQB0_9GLOM|nr:hypothetical protein C2G38_2139144 [Gigaspora rosea]
MIFAAGDSFSISCTFILNDQRPCDEYVKQPQLLEIDGKYNGYFTSNESFVPFSSQEGGTNGIGYMNITVQNPNKIISILILDNETDQYKSNGVLDASSTTKNYKDKPFNDLSTSFYMANQQIQSIEFTRNLLEKIRPQNKDMNGITPHLDKYYYISIDTQILVNLNGTSYSTLIISPLNYYLHKATEQRSFGLVGGAWTLFTSIYIFLFGTNLLQPFGFIQLSCLRSQASKKLKESLDIPLFSSHPDRLKHEKIDEELSLQLQRRIDTLETFLREYIIDTENYESIISPKENVTTIDNNQS